MADRIEIPDHVRRALAARTFWSLATVSEDGSPTSTPVWVDVDGDRVIVNTGAGRRKERNVRRDPRVALSLVQRDDPYSWIEIRGVVAEIVEGRVAEESFAALGEKYLGSGWRASPAPREPRVLLRIEPTRISFRTEAGTRAADAR